jgi:TRAP-type C4-dicarboxylate transport system permease small subunit
MLSEYKRTTNIGIGVGFVLVLFGKYLAISQPESAGFLAWLLCLVGIGFFVWGSSQYAKGKGHSPYWGVLGLFYIFGFVVLFFLPDRHKSS